MPITSLKGYVAVGNGSASFEKPDGTSAQEPVVFAIPIAQVQHGQLSALTPLRKTPSKNHVLAYSTEKVDFALSQTPSSQAGQGQSKYKPFNESDVIGKIPNSEIPEEIRDRFKS